MSDKDPKTLTEEEIAQLGDDEFMSMEFTTAVTEDAQVSGTGSNEGDENGSQESSEGDQGETQPEGDQKAPEGEEDEPEGNSEDDPDGENGNDGEDPDKKAPETVQDDPAKATKAEGDGGEDGAESDPQKAKAEKKADGEEDKIDYEAAYKTLMAPFKANGELFTPQSPEEMIKLAQMGANYSKKMNGLKPHLKTVRMLEENGILNDAKLSFLIDIDRGDPEAIKKLLKDKKIDPLDVDTSEDSKYTPVNRSVSDEDYNFAQTVEEVASTPEGKGMVGIVHKDWDTESKKILFQDPNILRVMFEQKQSGIYDQVSAEINRRRLLGDLRDTPFLHAYKNVGEEMTNQGRFAQTKAKAQNHGQQPSSDSSQRVVARGTGKRTPVVNNDKVKAASSPQSRPQGKKPQINPLELSDEDFMKDAEMGARFS